MFLLRDKVGDILEGYGFEYTNYCGCFDIIARDRQTLLLKTLSNIDSFQESQACNLKILSKSLGATSFLIGLRTRRENLKDNIIYERFDVPAFTPRTLENVLEGLMPTKYRFRGGLFAEVDPAELKKQRKNAKLSQSDLAEMIGVTKKSIYTYESKKTKISHETVVKIEKILGEIKVPIDISFDFNKPENKPRDRFEEEVSNDLNKLGFSSHFVYQTPFNIIARESEVLLLSDAEERQERIMKKIPDMINFSNIAKRPVLIVTTGEGEFELPSIKEEELRDISPNDLKRLLKNW